MATQRMMVEATKYGGRDKNGNPLVYTGMMPVDVKVPDVLPDDVPRFPNVKDDATVAQAERRFAELIASVPTSTQAVDDAYREYQKTLDSFAMGYV